MTVESLLISGYSSAELGIFRDSDPRITVIKQAIRDRLENHLSNGLKWLIFTGNLGFEYWTLQVANSLKTTDYPELQTATLFDFETHGKQWNVNNQAKLQLFKQTDFIKYSFSTYENPQQFRAHNMFLIDNTDGALILYDTERETRLRYLLKAMQEAPDYFIDNIDFEDLEEISEV